jgi:hypothetical protein
MESTWNIKNRENPLDQEKDKHGPINQHTTLNDGIFLGETTRMGRFLIFEVRGSTRYVSGYQGLKPSLNLWIIHDHSTSRFGDFRFVMGVPPHRPSHG